MIISLLILRILSIDLKSFYLKEILLQKIIYYIVYMDMSNNDKNKLAIDIFHKCERAKK